MKFVRLEMLFLIWTIPVLLLIMIYGMRRRRNLLNRFASGKGLKSVAVESSLKRRWIKCGLILLVVLFLIPALTGPQYGYRWQAVEQKGIDIVIALDCSKSMLATDVKPSRLARAKREVLDLLSMLKGDRVGLVAFAGTAFLQCPLTMDYEAFYLFLDALTPDFLPVGGSDIAAALRSAVSGFNETDNSEKAVILITDGDNTGDDPVKAAQAAQESNVKVFCVGVGSGSGVPVPDEKGGFKKDPGGKIVVTRLDEDLLKRIAVVTDGAYVRSVAGDMDLEVIYEREIRGKMDSVTLSSGKKQVWEDRFQWFLFISIVALIAEMLLPSTKKVKSLMLVWGVFFFSHSLVYAENTYEKVQKGINAYEKGDFEDALKYFIDAQLQEPDKHEIYYNIGNTYYQLNDYDSALKNYSEVLKSKEKALKQKTHYNMGNAKYRRHSLKEAVSEYQSALNLDPKDQQAKDNLEYVKKMLQQEKNKKPQDQEGKKGQKEKNGENHEGREKTKPEESEDTLSKSNDGVSKPEYGSEMNDPSESQTQQEALSLNASEKERQKTPAVMNRTDEQGQKQQAERMLNRLKDMPGRAMIPTYKPKQIEKDW